MHAYVHDNEIRFRHVLAKFECVSSRFSKKMTEQMGIIFDSTWSTVSKLTKAQLSIIHTLPLIC